MTAIQIVGVGITAVLAAGGLASFLWAVGKVKGIETSLTVLTDANKGLEAAYAQLKQRQEDERLECARELGMLRGQVQTLTGDFGRQIAKSIVQAIKETS